MQNFRNYYAILGVPRDATPEDIKRSYRKLARQYHPDMNPGDAAAEEKFKEVGEAYEVLSDPGKRAQYDQFSRYWKQSGFQTASTPKGKTWGNRSRTTAEDVDFSQFPDFNSFVDQLLNRDAQPATGEPQSSRDPYRPGTTRTAYTVPRTGARNAEARLTVPLEKAYTGGRERIRLEDGRSLEVNMPGGMVTGQKIRLKGQGVAGGDLYLKIDVPPHPFFRIEGADIHCKVPITPSEAVLGGRIDVPTLDGRVTMVIPAGVRPGQRLRLGGKGYPTEGDRGDQIVEIQVAIPKQLDPEEQDLYEKLRQIEVFDPRADLPV